MKKNGFTLLEILGVIVLLGIVAVLVVTLSNRTLKESKQSLYDSQKETIITSAKNWTIANNGQLPMSESDGEYKLTFKKLAEDGYIDNDELSLLILNRSENEVDDMIEEPEKEKTK